MKDWKKAVLCSLVGFCLISAIVGLFGLITFLQMSTTKIFSLRIADEERTLFVVTSVLSLVFAIGCIVLIAIVIMFFVKGKQLQFFKIVRILLAVISAVSVFFTIFAFCLPSILNIILKSNVDYILEFDLEYTSFVHYQSCLSAILSTFIPLLIADGIIIGYLIYTKVKQKQDGISDTSVSES
ncbi:MAG: hypothetical protein J1F69_00795 [Clostridiales bacterium]|nr:hypothetical protein [Clostridiales bacterium]